MADKQDQPKIGESCATSAIKESSNDPKKSPEDEKATIPFEYLVKLKLYLLDQTNFSGQFFEKIESKFGAPKS
uniref:Uncharacterized protein n=1 Tax=Romanomermis culicivorax TaxID=13658 RepID=A0A915KZ01_ROMCU